MEVGRPTKYKEEYIERVDEYLALHQDVKKDKELTVKLPTIEWFARFIGVPKRTLYDWKSEWDNYTPRDTSELTKEEIKKEEILRSKQIFSHSLEKINEEQRSRLLNNWLSGDYNSTIAKLILSSNHWMVERKDVTSDGKRVSISELSFDEDE